MALKEQYAIKNKKRLKQFVFLYAILVFLFMIYDTLAIYSNPSEGNVKVTLANWNIKINEKNLTDENTLLDQIVLMNEDGSTKIEAGDQGYFDIKIDPNGTEVSLEYKITLDLASSILPSGLVINSYSIGDENTKYNMDANNIVNGEILLNNKDILSESDAQLIRFYWNWKEESEETKSYTIYANVEVKQYMGIY